MLERTLIQTDHRIVGQIKLVESVQIEHGQRMNRGDLIVAEVEQTQLSQAPKGVFGQMGDGVAAEIKRRQILLGVEISRAERNDSVERQVEHLKSHVELQREVNILNLIERQIYVGHVRIQLDGHHFEASVGTRDSEIIVTVAAAFGGTKTGGLSKVGEHVEEK